MPAAAVPPPPALLLGRLADEERLRVLAAVTLGAASIPEVAERAGVSNDRAARALAQLAGVGLVEQGASGLCVNRRVLADAARTASPERRSPDLTPVTPEQERVVRNFVDGDGRLRSLPAREAKRRLVLQWVAGRFEPGRRYSEREVNAVLLALYHDAASLRRHLVDGGLLQREAGFYWVSGS